MHKRIETVIEAIGLTRNPILLTNQGLSQIYRVGDIIIKLSKISLDQAVDQLATARWLIKHDVRSVEPLDNLQPLVLDEYTATFWNFVQLRRFSEPFELGEGIKILNTIPPPPHLQGTFDPLRNTMAHIQQCPEISTVDKHFLIDSCENTKFELNKFCRQEPNRKFIHGDAWRGNYPISSTGHGIWTDFDNSCLGPAEWDLVPTAIEHFDLGRFDQRSYGRFVKSCGIDVTDSPLYPTLASAFHLQWLGLLIAKSSSRRWLHTELSWRISCLQDRIKRPWRWWYY